MPNLSTSPPDPSGGGLFDKPGKNVDPYHTCYALSGLSVAQHSPRVSNTTTTHSCDPSIILFPPALFNDVAGAEWGNELADIDPSINVTIDSVVFTKTYFALIDCGVDRETAAKRAAEAIESIAFKPVVSTIESTPGDKENTDDQIDNLPNICTHP